MSLAQIQIITASLVILLVAILFLQAVLRQKVNHSELVDYEIPAPHRRLWLLANQEAPGTMPSLTTRSVLGTSG